MERRDVAAETPSRPHNEAEIGEHELGHRKPVLNSCQCNVRRLNLRLALQQAFDVRRQSKAESLADSCEVAIEPCDVAFGVRQKSGEIVDDVPRHQRKRRNDDAL